MSRSPPSTFVCRRSMSADEIPVERVSLSELGITHKPLPAEFARLYQLFPPSSRLVLCFIFARDVFGEDAPRGWTKLGSGLTQRFGLEDRYSSPSGGRGGAGRCGRGPPPQGCHHPPASEKNPS